MYRFARSNVLALATLVAVLSAGAVGIAPARASASSASTVPVVGNVVDTPRAADEASAMAVARKYAHSVVDDSQTTEISQVSAEPDGTMKLVSNSLPVRVKQAGKWVPIDPKLTSVANGYSPAAAVTPVIFSAGGSGPIVKVQTPSGKWLSESWPYGDLPSPKIEGASATYEDVLPDVDLRLTATAAGMSEVLVIKSATAASNPQVHSIKLGLSGAKLSANGGVSTKAVASDKSTLASSTPIWWDSSHASASSDGPGDGGEAQPVTQAVTDDSVTLDLRSIVKSQTTVYPLYVDPDWSTGQQAYWFTDLAYPNTTYLNGQNITTGYMSVGSAQSGGRTYRSRAFFQFGTSALAGKHILNAVFGATETGSTTGDTSQVQIYRYGPATAGFTWNTDPGAWNQLLDSKVLPHATASAPQAVGWTATAGVAVIAAAGSSIIQIGLHSSNEASYSTRKHFALGGSLTVSYNTPPNTPANPVFSSPSRACGTAASPVSMPGLQPITLQATVTDADSGTNVNAAFYVVNGSTLAPVVSYGWPQQAQGIAQVTIPANTLSPGLYAWHADAGDNIDLSPGYSPYCYFNIVNASPSMPGISQTSTGTPTVGQPMTVQFTSTASDSVARYAYWWAVGVPGTPAAPPTFTVGDPLPACNTGLGAVRFVCPAPGSSNTGDITVAPVDVHSTLWVASYNDAGLVSTSSNDLSVIALADTANVGLSTGHIWDSQALSVSDTAVPDLNTTSGSSGSTTRQGLGLPLQLVDGDFFGIPTTVLNFTTSSAASFSERSAIDTKNSFTVSAWLLPSSTSSAVEHVAVSESTLTTPAFTLGTDASGKVQFCRTTQVTQAKTCVAGPALTGGAWTLVTGVWDSINQHLRLMIGDATTPLATASQAVPTGDSTAAGWFCVGGSCGTPSNAVATTLPWDGQVFRPAVFPGVVSSGQLDNLFNVLSPNDDPPADASVGSVVNVTCDQLITPTEMYNYDPNLAHNVGSWTPAVGSAAYRAQQWNGVGCQWIRETGNVSMYVSVASIVDRGTMVQLQTAAQQGTAVTGLGDSAYYANNELQIFRGTYWLVLQYDWAGSSSGFAPLADDASAALP